MPNPAIIRTENASILWTEESQFGQFMPVEGVAWGRFGIHEEMTIPFPQEAWSPYFSFAGSRSRADIFPGRLSFTGSIPNIRMQRGSNQFGNYAFGVLSMAIGQIQIQPINQNGVQFLRILENQDAAGFDGRVPSFNLLVEPRATDGSQPAIFQWTGCKINNWSLTAAEGGPLMLNIDEFIPTRMFSSLVSTVVYSPTVQPVPDPGPSNAGQFFFIGATVLVNGLPFARVKNMTLSGSNQLDVRYYLSTLDNLNQVLEPPPVLQIPNDLPEGKRTYSLTLELDVVDPALDMNLFSVLLNEGRDVGTGVIAGYPIQIVFLNQDGTGGPFGQGSMSFVINCSPRTVPPPNAPGIPPAAVALSGGMNLPAPPQGYWDGRLNLDLDSIYIDYRIS